MLVFRYQEILKEVVVPVISNEQCQKNLRENTRLGPFFELDSSFMCAGGVQGVDTCKGDGGSPLVCPSKYDPYTYIQAGIVAWGIGCGGDTPGAYAAVSEAVCWVDLVTSCHYGASSPASSVPSHFSYSRAQCGSWLQGTLARLSSLPARVRRVLEAEYNQCQVDYRDNINQQEELFDFSMFERVGNPDTGR